MQSPENVFSFHNALTNCFSLAINTTFFFTSRLCHRNVHQTRFDIRRVSISRLFPYLHFAQSNLYAFKLSLSDLCLANSSLSNLYICYQNDFYPSHVCLNDFHQPWWHSATLWQQRLIGRSVLRALVVWSLAWETNFSLVYLYHICLYQAHISRHLWAIFTNQRSSHIVTIRFSSHRSTAAGTKLPLSQTTQLEQISLTASRRGFAGLSSQSTASEFFFLSFSRACKTCCLSSRAA